MGQALPQPGLRAGLLDCTGHERKIHPTGSKGTVVLARRDGTSWREAAVAVSDLPDAMVEFGNRPDAYLSQARFWAPRRRIATLAELGALFADLDYYNQPDLQGLSAWVVLELVLEALDEAGLPDPSLAIDTGRGLPLVWLHKAIPRQALPRWNACQKTLYEALQSFGADPMAKDAARVLRLCGTINTKSGRKVECLAGLGEVWDFDVLADEILPQTRAELHDLRVQRALRRGKRGQKTEAPEGFTQATLWEARLADLQELLTLRGWTPLAPGQRDAWMFVAGVAVCWIAEPAVLRRELPELAEEVAGSDEQEAQSRLYSVIERAERAARGEKVEWQGVELDARYLDMRTFRQQHEKVGEKGR